MSRQIAFSSIRQLTATSRVVIAIICVMTLGWVVWVVWRFCDPGPGPDGMGNVAAAIGTWKPDPEGADAALDAYHLEVAHSKELRSQLTTKAQRLATADTVLTIDAGGLQIVDQHGPGASIRGVLQAQRGYTVGIMPPGADADAEPLVIFKQTARGLVWASADGPVPLRRK